MFKLPRFVEKKFSTDSDTIAFEDLVPATHTRKTAALAFYQLLCEFDLITADHEK